MRIDAEFVLSAATAADLPRDGLAELALVGRSNVGKSSLINALVRRRIARTSGAPGKTRLANVYRVARGGAAPFYLVDLPGYGYAKGDRGELEAVARAYFGRVGQVGRVAVLLLIDARHPGLASDRAAWEWLNAAAGDPAIVATKADKLSRAERRRAIGENEAVFGAPVLAVSAVTGEGLDRLWTLIDQLLNSRSRPRPSRPPSVAAPARTPHRKN